MFIAPLGPANRLILSPIAEYGQQKPCLKMFGHGFPDQVKLRVRFSLDNLKLDGDMLNIPLFMADQTDRLIGLALDQKKI